LAKAQGGKEQGVESENISPFDEGWDFFDEKDYSRAATAFQEAVERDAQDGEAHYYLALCYRELGDFRAVSEMERALALDGELENGHYELGVTYKMLNVKNKAEEQFLEELIGNPDHEKSAIHLAEIYAERKDYPGVIGLLKKHRSGTRNCDLLTLLGYAYYETGEYGQAIFAFKEAVDYDSSHIRASLGLAATFIEVENWSQGIKVMSDIMLLEPDNPMIHYLLGVLRAGDGDIESARREKEILRGLGDEGNKLSNELGRLISRIERR
jgi:tetratricopeptide (TPR) repeat protein